MESSSGTSTLSGESKKKAQLAQHASSDELADLRAYVQKIYAYMRDYYERKVGDKGAAAFEHSRALQVASIPRLSPAELSTFELHEVAVPKNKLFAALKRPHSNAVVNKCPLVPIDHVEAQPPMQYWTHTEANINAEDEYTLSHIPFLGDSEDDTSFCQELMSTFPDGIHGTKEGCGEYINDYILYYLLKRIKEDAKMDEKTMYAIVYELFPNKASRHELKSMFPDLQQRFEPNNLNRQEFTNELGELEKHFSDQHLLNSYEMLLCHKCFSYDCVMHNATIHNGYGGGKKSRKFRTSKEHNNHQQQQANGASGSAKSDQQLQTPCSARCYMHTSAASNGTKLRSPTQNRRQSVQQQLNVEVGQSGPANAWTPHEESIIGILHSTGEQQSCRIAKMLNLTLAAEKRRTCEEVFAYLANAGQRSPHVDLSTSPLKQKSRKNWDTHRTFRAMKWANTNGKVENNAVFRPCKGKCDCRSNGCGCIKNKNLCTKYCGCAEDCKNRFPGCRCAPGNCRTKQCQCYYASWECDPDVCTKCNCDKFDGSGEPICKNVSIQRGLQKRLTVAPSQVAGWGCFANEDIDKNDFISEYCGEVISQAESERRGKIYDRIKCSYLFGLNDEQVVDATRIGNVIRFANHSRNPNCRAKVIVVNGDHKIGIFAQRAIKSGEELFFNYAYNKSQQVEFVPKELLHVAKQQRNEKVEKERSAHASSLSD